MLALPEAQFFTGIDWASAEHAVCVLDAAGKITAQFTIARSAEGIASLVRRLARYGDPELDLPLTPPGCHGQQVLKKGTRHTRRTAARVADRCGRSALGDRQLNRTERADLVALCLRFGAVDTRSRCGQGATLPETRHCTQGNGRT